VDALAWRGTFATDMHARRVVFPRSLPVTASALPMTPAQMRSAAARALVTLGVLAAGLAALAVFARAPMEAAAQRFMDVLGWPGLALSVFLADAIHLPPPPQFHLLLVVTAGLPVVPALTLICTASVLGGATSRLLGGWLGAHRWAAALMAYSTPRVAPLFRQRGHLTVVVAALTPVPFCTVCFLSGAFRMQRGLVLLMLALRVPRLLLFYAAIRAGWSVG
jgi:membrane protein YqaA with SNARE-associated domain